MDLGTITNYKYYENPADQKDGWHFYEINHNDSGKNYYIKSKDGNPIAFGSEVPVDITLKKAYIRNRVQFLEGPFDKTVHTVNYQGFVLDCIDSDFGIYNLDNEILLFGSGCLDFPVGASVTLFNLHLISLSDSTWIFKLFGSTLKKSAHLLVYCPAFSSYIETGCDEVVYDNIVSVKSNVFSHALSWKWLQTHFRNEIVFPGFQGIDELAHCLFANSSDESQFMGHCEKCLLTCSSFDQTSATQLPKPISASDIKSIFHTEKSASMKSNSSSSCSNEAFTMISWFRGEVVHGILNRKNSLLFELTSGDKKVLLFAPDLNISDNSFALIFNAVGIVEILPNLHYPNMPTVKAYLWLSPDSKVWTSSSEDYTNLRTVLNYSEDEKILCKIIRKYSVLKQVEGGKIAEVLVIQLESGLGSRTFYLKPDEKYYAIVCDDSRGGPMAIRHFISKHYFKESNEPIFLAADALKPTLKCTLNSEAATNSKDPLQVQLADLPYLKLVPGLQLFALKLQFYSPISLKFQLNCSECKTLVEGGRCLIHREAFSPILLINGVFEVSDQTGTQTTILIDSFSHLKKIYEFKQTFWDKLIEILKRIGRLSLSAENLSFNRLLKAPTTTSESTENIVASMFPRISRAFLCTFKANMANSALKPIEIEKLNIKLELTNILKTLS